MQKNKRKMGNPTPFKIVTPENFVLKLCTRDYVGEMTLRATFGFIYFAPFPSYGSLLVKFSLATVDGFTLTPSLGVIPCEFPDDLYLFRN